MFNSIFLMIKEMFSFAKTVKSEQCATYVIEDTKQLRKINKKQSKENDTQDKLIRDLIIFLKEFKQYFKKGQKLRFNVYRYRANKLLGDKVDE